MVQASGRRWLGVGDDEAGSRRRSGAAGRKPLTDDGLDYRIELWDEDKRAVEQVLAITVSVSIAYAAYFAATRDYPDRYITLRDKTVVLSRWNGPPH